MREAVERLEATTGLVFAAGAAPRVVLAPLGDEDVPHRVRTEVVDGRAVRCFA